MKCNYLQPVCPERGCRARSPQLPSTAPQGAPTEPADGAAVLHVLGRTADSPSLAACVQGEIRVEVNPPAKASAPCPETAQKLEDWRKEGAVLCIGTSRHPGGKAALVTVKKVISVLHTSVSGEKSHSAMQNICWKCIQKVVLPGEQWDTYPSCALAPGLCERGQSRPKPRKAPDIPRGEGSWRESFPQAACSPKQSHPCETQPPQTLC